MEVDAVVSPKVKALLLAVVRCQFQTWALSPFAMVFAPPAARMESRVAVPAEAVMFWQEKVCVEVDYARACEESPQFVMPVYVAVLLAVMTGVESVAGEVP